MPSSSEFSFRHLANYSRFCGCQAESILEKSDVVSYACCSNVTVYGNKPSLVPYDKAVERKTATQSLKMPKNEQNLKWTCEYCTYLNWPTSSKCVMCRAAKSHVISRRASPIHDIISDADGEDVGSTVSRSSSDEIICPSDSDKTLSNFPRKIQEVKWNCPSCTYQNWPRSDRCVMCHVLKPQHLRKIESQRNLENNGESTSGNLVNSNSKLDIKYDKDKKKVLSRNSKWICPKCTYENWLKNAKCVICHCPRNRAKQDENGTKPSHEKGRNNSRNGSSPRSPPRSPTGACHKVSETSIDTSKGDDDQLIELSNIMAAACRLRSNDNASIRQIRNRLSARDWLWLAACKGIIDHNPTAVGAYLRAGGDRTKQLTREDVLVLNEPEHYEIGHTLVHLAIRYHREDILRMLLTPEVPTRAVKRLPSHISPELATTVRKQIAHAIRQRRGGFQCSFFTEQVTFSLPGEIRGYDVSMQHQIFSEIMDLDVQKIMEGESLINWSSELSGQYSSRIYPLWNRAAGDCLLDSVLQATWGVLDRENTLRRALYESLLEGKKRFFPRWREAEEMQASEMNYSLDEDQWKQDWSNVVSLAATAGSSLEQTHVFALAHILRRPIIVYAVKYVKSMRGETIDYARFEGVYLPVLWESSFCWKNPIALGYTRGHFSALVPMETSSDNNIGASSSVDFNEDAHVTYFPLVDHEGHLLPIHFQTAEEVGQEERLLQTWMDCCLTDGGILVARQRLTPRPALVNQMIDEWLNRFRKMQAEIHESHGAYKI